MLWYVLKLTWLYQGKLIRSGDFLMISGLWRVLHISWKFIDRYERLHRINSWKRDTENSWSPEPCVCQTGCCQNVWTKRDMLKNLPNEEATCVEVEMNFKSLAMRWDVRQKWFAFVQCFLQWTPPHCMDSLLDEYPQNDHAFVMDQSIWWLWQPGCWDRVLQLPTSGGDSSVFLMIGWLHCVKMMSFSEYFTIR